MDDSVRKRLMNPDLDHLDTAKERGIYEPLAAYIEAGYSLHHETRAWLAKLMRGQLPAKKPGNKRTREKELEDFQVLWEVRNKMHEVGCTENAAIESYCAEREANKETVKTALRRLAEIRELFL